MSICIPGHPLPPLSVETLLKGAIFFATFPYKVTNISRSICGLGSLLTSEKNIFSTISTTEMYVLSILLFHHGRVRGKKQKKLTNVSFVCMSVGRKSEMLVFSVFFQTEVIHRLFQWSLWKKNRKMLVFM